MTHKERHRDEILRLRQLTSLSQQAIAHKLQCPAYIVNEVFAAASRLDGVRTRQRLRNAAHTLPPLPSEGGVYDF